MYVLVSPCICHPDLRADGITSDEDKTAFAACLRRCAEFGIDVVEMPCPETRFFGTPRSPGPFVGRMDTPAFTALLDELELNVRTKIEKEPPLAIIGVNSSPTCGATSTYYTDVKSAGRGAFLSRFSEIPVIDVKVFAQYKVYFAGPLFSESEREFNQKVANRLAEIFYSCHLPQNLDDDEENRTENRERLIYDKNLAALKNADIVVAVIDGADADSGTAWEMGYATALGKRILALRTDFRRVSDNELVNLMLESDAEICSSVDELICRLRPF